jgi:hypothetical protein
MILRPNKGIIKPRRFQRGNLNMFPAGTTVQPLGGGAAPFVEFRSAGTRYESPTDGVGPFALGKPAGYGAGDLLVVAMQGTFFSGTHPTENPGPWTYIINTSTQIVGWRVATGDANDDWTCNTVSTTSVHTAQMAAFDLKGLTSVSNVAGGSLLTNDSSYGLAFPACSFSQYNNDFSLTLSYWFKSQNNAAGAISVIDNQIAAVTGADVQATIDSGAVNGLANNPAGLRSSWYGWSYWVTNGNPADAVAFGIDQTESPESSGFEVVSHYGSRFRIIT